MNFQYEYSYIASQHWLDMNGLSMDPNKTVAVLKVIGTVDLGQVNLTTSHSV